MRDIRIAAVQFEARDADKDHNVSRIAELTQCAAAQGAEIVSFHECCITGYTFLQTLSDAQLAALAEPVPGGPSTCRLIDLARQFRVALMAGLVESEGGKLYNTYVAVTADGFVQKHRKLHPFIHPGIAPGCDYSVFELCGVRCGILICYDNNLPENPRILTLIGRGRDLCPPRNRRVAKRHAGKRQDRSQTVGKPPSRSGPSAAGIHGP